MVIIREAELKDCNALAKVHVDSWKSAYEGIIDKDFLNKLNYECKEKAWEERIINKNIDDIIYVAEAGGTVVGFAAGGFARWDVGKDFGEIYALYILKEYHKKGIGRLLIKKFCEALKGKLKVNSMIIWALKQNPSCGFYEAMGGIRSKEKEVEIGGKLYKEYGFLWKDIKTLLKE
ncbi:GNAT family N-acetyltransferase [Desnuesiella massiliensis]|uniref:GNAT family N-acetyltransferase n=1 Tax=Desnuesiella massiliensis TaxID=1650662 RepID=UPI0006E17EBC|nr:GNAT family N-acetyltransferase [Desnuesiella massiliensis]